MNKRQSGSLILRNRADGSEARLRHKVLNDYQAIIAFIVTESAKASEPQVKAALQRVADRVYDLASFHQHSNG